MARGSSAFVWIFSWGMLAEITIPLASPLMLEYLAGESGLLTLIEVALLSTWLIHRWLRQGGDTATSDGWSNMTTVRGQRHLSATDR